MGMQSDNVVIRPIIQSFDSIRMKNRHEDRILLGSRGWRNSGAGFEEAAGYSLDAMIFQYNHLCLPMGLLGGNYGISYAEKKIDGKIFPVLQLTGANGPPMEWL